MLNRRGEQSGAVENAKTAVGEAEDKLAEIAAQIEALGTVTDVSKLATVIKATREIGDIAGQIANSKREEQEARAAIDRGLKALRPAVADHDALESMSVPPLASVEAHRDACRNLEQRLQTCRERMRNAEQELARHRKAYERIIADEHVVAPDELGAFARAGATPAGRSSGAAMSTASRFRTKRLLAFSSADELAQAFEAAMRDADEAADRRFENIGSRSPACRDRQTDQRARRSAGIPGARKRRRWPKSAHALDAAWKALWAAHARDARRS